MHAEKKATAIKSHQPARRRFLQWVGSGLLVLGLPRPLLAMMDSQRNYTETIAVLKKIHADEMKAELRYMAFAKKARSEGYKNIAHMFTALAASEAIHARNFKAILAGLGVKAKGAAAAPVKVSSTRLKKRVRARF